MSKESEKRIEELEGQLNEANAKLAESDTIISTLKEQNAALKDQLNASGRKGYPPEVVKMAQAKIQAGLAPDDAYEVAVRQYEHDKNKDKDAKKGSKAAAE